MSADRPVRPAQIWIVADDLTGACDAAVAFAQRGARTQVLLDPGLRQAPVAEVIAFSTGTRDLPLDEATQQLQAALSSHLPFSFSSPKQARQPTLFKKIDSVLRGNTLHEIYTTINAFPHHTAILAPAYPAQGRITHEGNVIATDLTGRRTLTLHTELSRVGIEARPIPANKSTEALADRMQTADVFLCDASEQAHLEAIVASAHMLDRPILWIGSAGLAHALASNTFAAEQCNKTFVPKGKILAFIGSDHPVTLRQVETLHTAHKVALWTGAMWDEPARIAVMSVERGVTSDLQIQKAVIHLEGGIACLFLTGGDTAAQVCQALGIQALCLQQEFAPGIPQATAMGGPFGGTTVILKSGGFGEAGLLLDIAQHFNLSEAQR